MAGKKPDASIDASVAGRMAEAAEYLTEIKLKFEEMTRQMYVGDEKLIGHHAYGIRKHLRKALHSFEMIEFCIRQKSGEG